MFEAILIRITLMNGAEIVMISLARSARIDDYYSSGS